MTHPIALIAPRATRHRRWRALLRPLLVIPLVVWGFLWSIAVLAAAVVSWITTLVRGTSPDALHRFIARYLRFSAQAFGYAGFLTESYPGFLGDRAHPVDLAPIPNPGRQDRLRVAGRLLLAIPVLILAEITRNLWCVIAFFAWIVCVWTGALPTGLRNISAWTLRFHLQAVAYLTLVTDRYPQIDIEPRIGPALAY